MRSVQIFHEAPLSLFDKVQYVTDGDYALVHLLENDEKYKAKFKQIYDARQRGSNRPLILDNSAYELGASFDVEKFASWVYTLEPDIYIVPDVIGSGFKTVDSFSDWCKKYPNTEGRKMGVVQGSNLLEAAMTFRQLKEAGADIIGIPFLVGRSWESRVESGPPSLNSLMLRRVALVNAIWDNFERHPIHLLGVALPQEGWYYREMNWIESVDTSNPVMHGMFGSLYTSNGVNTKRPELLADLIHQEVSLEQEACVLHNIEQFRRLWRRA